MIKERYLGGLESLERGWREDILMAETPTAITLPSIVGSKQYLDMFFSSMSCTFSLEGSSISVSVWEILREENFWKNTLLNSLSRQLFSPPSTVGSGCNLDMLFVLMLSRFGTVEIRNNHSEQKLCFLHSRSTSFRRGVDCGTSS